MPSLTNSLARWLTNYDDQASMGSRFRAKRIGPLLSMIEAASHEHGRVDIIDLGGTDFYWGIVPPEYLQKHRVSITIVNPLGSEIKPDRGPFHFVHGDGCNLADVADKQFHIAHSNSVVEHVGDWDRMVRFAAELQRVSHHYFVQTPNFWFPVEPHFMTPFFHWLPQPTRVWLVRHFQLGHWPKASSVDEAVRIVENARLLNRDMMKTLFPNGPLITERVMSLPKSFVAVSRL